MSVGFRSEQLKFPISGTFTGSFIGDGSQLTNVPINTGSLVTTSSFNAYTSSAQSQINSLIQATGSYATTGSNSFIGDQYVNGFITASSIELRRGNTDADTPYYHQLKFDYYGGGYSHYVVTRHSIDDLTSSSIDFWINKSSSYAQPYSNSTERVLSINALNVTAYKDLNVLGNIYGTSSYALNAPNYVLTSSFNAFTSSIQSANTSSLVTTASFNAFTSSIQSQVNSLTTATSSYILASQTSSMTVLSSSFATTASYLAGYVSPFPFTGSAIISGSLSVTGSTNLSGTAGSTLFSSNADTLVITGSLLVTGSINLVGLMTGTASYANQSLSSSFANSAVSASFASTSSFAVSASYIDGGFY